MPNAAHKHQFLVERSIPLYQVKNTIEPTRPRHMLVKINIRQQAMMEIVKEPLVATIRN
jgi:hypothetical protein